MTCLTDLIIYEISAKSSHLSLWFSLFCDVLADKVSEGISHKNYATKNTVSWSRKLYIS